MPIRGDFQTMSPAELLQFLALGDKTGTVEIWSATTTIRLTLRDGKITSSATTDPQFQLGAYLVRHGYIDNDERERSVTSQKDLGMSLGKMLVTLAVLSEKELLRILKLKAEEEVLQMFGWDDAEFVFIANEHPVISMVELQVNPVAVVMEALRRRDEAAQSEAAVECQVVSAGPEEASPATLLAQQELRSRAATRRFFVAIPDRSGLQRRYHAPDCAQASVTKRKKRTTYETTIDAESNGLAPCSHCLPHLAVAAL